MHKSLTIGAILVTTLVACGPQKKTERVDPTGTGGGEGGGSGDQVPVTDPCAAGYATVTGTLGAQDVGFRVVIAQSDYTAPKDGAPGALTLSLQGGGKIWMQFLNAPDRGSLVATRAFVVSDDHGVEVGHCADSVYSGQLVLDANDERKGSFVLTDFFGHDGDACDMQPVTGVLTGCFHR